MSVFRFLPFMRAFRHIPLFDRAFYLRKYPDLAAAGVNPLLHYVRYGAAEGRKPHPLFDPEYYLRRYPELRGNTNPLLHFLEHSRANPQTNPHPLFHCEAYRQAHPEAAAEGVNPLVHHLRQLRAGRNTASGTEGSLFGCAS
jgi:hypothetical protein